jgi:chorismate mutase
MSDGNTPLSALREEINGIDDDIHALLMRRAAIAAYCARFQSKVDRSGGRRAKRKSCAA